jgi:hypothetical protein
MARNQQDGQNNSTSELMLGAVMAFIAVWYMGVTFMNLSQSVALVVAGIMASWLFALEREMLHHLRGVSCTSRERDWRTTGVRVLTMCVRAAVGVWLSVRYFRGGIDDVYFKDTIDDTNAKVENIAQPWVRAHNRAWVGVVAQQAGWHGKTTLRQTTCLRRRHGGWH